MHRYVQKRHVFSIQSPFNQGQDMIKIVTFSCKEDKQFERFVRRYLTAVRDRLHELNADGLTPITVLRDALPKIGDEELICALKGLKLTQRTGSIALDELRTTLLVLDPKLPAAAAKMREVETNYMMWPVDLTRHSDDMRTFLYLEAMQPAAACSAMLSTRRGHRLTKNRITNMLQTFPKVSLLVRWPAYQNM